MTQQLENILPILQDEHQKQALQNAMNIGVPSMKNEEWKYTYFQKIWQQDFNPVLSSTTFDFNDIKTFIDNNATSSNRLVFVNGLFQHELSNLQNHPSINFWNAKNTASTNSNDFLLELNNALSTDGIFIEIGNNVVVDDLIEIFYIHSIAAPFINIKNKIKIGKNAIVKFAEQFINYDEQTAYYNTVTALEVAESANIEWNKIQDGGNNFYITDNMHIEQAAKSICAVNTFSFSGGITRNVLTYDVNGERSESHMNGLSLLLNNEHVDNRTLVNHNVANCESYELYKNILGGTSTGVFNGKIIVAQAAQKTNAFQSNRTILLSNDATINTKPQLEIFADDVKCSHGATSSQIEDSELFYLQARGIGKETARGLLVFAFGEEVVEKINHQPLKEKVEKRVAELLKIEL